ncbi:dihydroneopterin triphosphate diphosphatase [Mycoavidus sp. SF9855]|uniref:dihydroneopterin triphosphate diphosphatase n=1 Tax=Mycoavidus sp. SF9855 TaxID=2968475 RepID=UPI00211CCEC1|nr:dihydroneopterin triphosphate diphosphatase [Mycoavidus sp. SF9855]UUM21827.1 dihydroneopterin triphosphate diphosphatase [Mycoavidus sp. SF9855]
MDSYKLPESALIVIYTAELEVLLIERTDYPGFWQSVTGSKDHQQETLDETARREVLEETGIVIGSSLVPLDALVNWHWQVAYPIYPIWRHRYAKDVTHNTEHWFGLLVPRDIAIMLAPREHTAYTWLPYLEAAARCFSPSNRAAILQLPARSMPKISI